MLFAQNITEFQKGFQVNIQPSAVAIQLDGILDEPAWKTAAMAKDKELGSQLSAPFMTLSFMALLVIPHLKLSDKGLFDGDQFKLF